MSTDAPAARLEVMSRLTVDLHGRDTHLVSTLDYLKRRGFTNRTKRLIVGKRVLLGALNAEDLDRDDGNLQLRILRNRAWGQHR